MLDQSVYVWEEDGSYISPCPKLCLLYIATIATIFDDTCTEPAKAQDIAMLPNAG